MVELCWIFSKTIESLSLIFFKIFIYWGDIDNVFLIFEEVFQLSVTLIPFTFYSGRSKNILLSLNMYIILFYS